MDPARTAGTGTVPDRDANLARNADQATAGIQISDDIPRPSDNLPTLANIVTAAMSNRSYIPLFYLTVEGRHAADREGLNSTNPLDGFKASHSQLKSLRRDRDLSISEIHEAGKVLVELMGQYKLGQRLRTHVLQFFRGDRLSPLSQRVWSQFCRTKISRALRRSCSKALARRSYLQRWQAHLQHRKNRPHRIEPLPSASSERSIRSSHSCKYAISMHIHSGAFFVCSFFRRSSLQPRLCLNLSFIRMNHR